ncbi:RNA-directed DNA polymerase (plasmid) [Rickettsia endosymbiont of Ixodes scapularis]|nr:RNA-directed DNA polymerase [Rickettsia endosymbiont of Ixodes scapularis]
MAYFHLDKRKNKYAEIDGIRRRVRCYRLKQRKGGKSLAKWLIHILSLASLYMSWCK